MQNYSGDGYRNPSIPRGDTTKKQCQTSKEQRNKEHHILPDSYQQENAENELQKIHDKMIKKVDDLLAEKNKEIMTV